MPLPQERAQYHHLVLGPKRRRQQAVAVQPLNPLAIEHVTLLPAWGHDGLHLLGKNGGHGRGSARNKSSLPNGDTPRRAASDVNASSRDQASRRAQGTIEGPATSTRGPRPSS